MLAWISRAFTNVIATTNNNDFSSLTHSLDADESHGWCENITLDTHKTSLKRKSVFQQDKKHRKRSDESILFKHKINSTKVDNGFEEFNMEDCHADINPEEDTSFTEAAVPVFTSSLSVSSSRETSQSQEELPQGMLPFHTDSDSMMIPKLNLTSSKSDGDSHCSRHDPPIFTPDCDDIVTPSCCRGKSKRISQSSRTTKDSYQPSSKIVDKNLSKSIVSSNVEESELSEDGVLAKKHNVKKSEMTGESFDISMEKARRWAAAVRLPSGHWAEAERDLFFRLAMRGFEPLIPSSWRLDFDTLPESLFSLSGTAYSYITSVNGNEFRGEF